MIQNDLCPQMSSFLSSVKRHPGLYIGEMFFSYVIGQENLLHPPSQSERKIKTKYDLVTPNLL